MAMVVKGIVKLIEELGELQTILAKKLAYLDTDIHPDGKGSMKERIQEEMGDVIAAIKYVKGTLSLDDDWIEKRALTKYELYKKWEKEP